MSGGVDSMNPDDLVHIVDWPRFVRYAREDRSYSDTWRPPYVNIDVSATLDAAEELTETQLGYWFRLVLEYASCPALDPSAGPHGRRRMTVKRALSTFRAPPKHRLSTFVRLNHAGLIEVSSGHRPDEQQQTAVEQDLRPSRARARADAQVKDQDQEIGEGTAAAGSPASESEIREAVASLPGSDRGSLNVVEPLAMLVPGETFHELVERARPARNPVGWLVERLRACNREQRLDEQDAAVAQAPPKRIPRLTPEQALEANVCQLAANGHPWEAIAEQVKAQFGEEHLDAAEAIYARVSEAA